MASNSDLIQRLAAPIPRVSDVVSDKVCRVPKLTNLPISCSIVLQKFVVECHVIVSDRRTLILLPVYFWQGKKTKRHITKVELFSQSVPKWLVY
jgi:hypothetical protein